MFYSIVYLNRNRRGERARELSGDGHVNVDVGVIQQKSGDNIKKEDERWIRVRACMR